MERFRTLTRNYYRNAHAAVFVYSVSEASSLHYLNQWIKDTQSFAPSAIKMLIGNKVDLESEIDETTAKSFASTYDFELQYLISCKTNQGIADAFEQLARVLHKSPGGVSGANRAQDPVAGGVNLEDPPQQRRCTC